MGDIKYELFDDGYDDHSYGKQRMEAAYEEYRDLAIEVDEKILKIITSFKIGSFLSLEVLVDFADKYECKRKWINFWIILDTFLLFTLVE